MEQFNASMFNPYMYSMAIHKNQQFEQEKPWMRASKNPSLIVKGTELFVGNLSLDVNEQDLYDEFKEFGEIVDIRVHKNIQNKKCYAFVRFQSKDMLCDALSKNMCVLKGRKMKVTKSNENSTIFIGNIRKNWSKSDVEIKVRRIFPNCEKIEHFNDPLNSNKNRGFCFVVFKNRNEAIKALNYVSSKGGINIDGIPLTCDWADVVEDYDCNSKQIFLSGLDDNIDDSTLRNIFSKYGTITEVVLSRNHKSSKRKDLSFITFSTYEEAKNALNYDTSTNELGQKVSVSIAFSQQAMQIKKKIKEARKKTSNSSPQLTPTNNVQTATMLTMMNLINMNKNNLDPNIMAQMVTACLETMIQNKNTENNILGNKRQRKFVRKKRRVLGVSRSNNMNTSNITNNILNNPSNFVPQNTFVNPNNYINPSSLNLLNNYNNHSA